MALVDQGDARAVGLAGAVLLAGLLVTSAARPPRIVLDAGHGGLDPGAVRGDVREADINLAITRPTADLLRERGHRVLLTRVGDDTVRLEDRVEASAGADLFLSIHANATRDAVTSARGAEAFGIPAALGFLGYLQAGWVATPGLPPWRSARVHDRPTLFVLEKTRARAAALLEVGFINNPADLAILRDPASQKVIAGVITRAVDQAILDWPA